MNQLTKPESDEICSAYPQGVLDQYNATELNQIDKVQQAGQIMSKSKHMLNCEVIRLKLLLDGQDQVEGLLATGNGGQQPSRFWEGARAGHFGDEVKSWADKDDRKKVQRLITANEAAAKLLAPCVANATHDLPFELARKRGMGQTALCTYQRLFPEARAMADHYFTVTGELRSDMLQEFEQIIREFPERTEFVLKGITERTLDVPSKFKDLKAEWRAQAREQKAAEEALAQAAKLAAAEKKEEDLNDYTPDVDTPSKVGDQAADVTARRTPSRAWYQSQAGKQQVSEVVGNLDKPLPDLIEGLMELSNQLKDQFAHSSVMPNYAEFWAGYDQFFYTPSTHRAKWGRKRRLGRMQDLRKKMLEVAGELEVYIASTQPPANIEYPEG